MSRQSTSAAAGRSTMTTRLALPLRSGTSQAPAISTSPGCTHSTVIVVFRPREPQLPQQLGDDDDRHARDQTVERAPGRQILEDEVRVVRLDEMRHNDLGESEYGQTCIEPAREPSQPDRVFQLLFEKSHRINVEANIRTGSG